MAESDFLSYNSIYNSFSKGPKSIYYALGDEMLPGAILNIPQDDKDDEWGRTERIALERNYDFIGRIYKTLFDPYNSMPEISLVPGEAGSELNIAKNMIKLIGRPGIEEGVFNLSIPKLTLGNVEVNGDTDKITIGSGLELSSNQISLSSLLTINNTSNKGSINFKNVKIDLNDNGTIKNIEINVDGKKYTFTKDGIELDVGLTIGVNGTSLLNSSGDLTTKNIFPIENKNYDIGSPSLLYRHLYSDKITNFYLCTNYIHPFYSYIEIGKADFSTRLSLYSEFLTMKVLDKNVLRVESLSEGIIFGDTAYLLRIKSNETKVYTNNFSFYTSESEMVPYFSISPSSINTVKDIVPLFPSIVSIGANDVPFGYGYISNIYSRIGKFDERIESGSIFPISDLSYDIGTEVLRYNKIYARYVHKLDAITNDGRLIICGNPITFRIETDSFMYIDENNIVFVKEAITRDLRPFSPYNTVGTICGGYHGLFLQDWATGLVRMIYLQNGEIKVY